MISNRPGSTPARELDQEELLHQYSVLRASSDRFASFLEPEDCVVQSMPDVSPTRWHLAHTTWFFETFVLAPSLREYTPFDPAYEYLFNSYYNTVGKQPPRAQRGTLSRPTVANVHSYRAAVDKGMKQLLEAECLDSTLLQVIELGLAHEGQHLELMHTDIKHVFFQNPLLPAFRAELEWQPTNTAPLQWIERSEGLQYIGQQEGSFGFDNERPRHRQFLEGYELANRLVTCGEYLDFIEDGGYRTPQLWLSEGWKLLNENDWQAPLYWRQVDGQWRIFSLAGDRPLRLDEPVCHVSYFEADAYARWSQARLPTEAEWEVVAAGAAVAGNLLEQDRLHPSGAGEPRPGQASQLFGDTWEWTATAYSAYPGYRTAAGALGEYNGKFMCNQYVLRGGSCVTPAAHVRPTYRNFMPPDARWQFSGIRLAR